MEWNRQPNDDGKEPIDRGYGDDDGDEEAYEADGTDAEIFLRGTPETSIASPTCHWGEWAQTTSRPGRTASATQTSLRQFLSQPTPTSPREQETRPTDRPGHATLSTEKISWR